MVYPLSFFGYVTNGDGVVDRRRACQAAAPPALPEIPRPRGAAHARHARRSSRPAPRAVDPIRVGDRVRIDRITPVRPQARAGRARVHVRQPRPVSADRARRAERVVHLVAHARSRPERASSTCCASCSSSSAVALGAMLFLIKPEHRDRRLLHLLPGRVEAPSTYLDDVVPMPWRRMPALVDESCAARARPALLLFALCLIDGDDGRAARAAASPGSRRRSALALGALQRVRALAADLRRPARAGRSTASTATLERRHGAHRHRARGRVRARARRERPAPHRLDRRRVRVRRRGRLASDALFPGHIPLWLNSLLVSTGDRTDRGDLDRRRPAPVLQRRLRREPRGACTSALTAALVGTIARRRRDRHLHLLQQQRTSAYGVYAISIGDRPAVTGKIDDVLDHARRPLHLPRSPRSNARRSSSSPATSSTPRRSRTSIARCCRTRPCAQALVRRHLGTPAATAATRSPQSYDWPTDCDVQARAERRADRAITRTRGALTFSGKDTRLIQRSFPNEQLTFAAPLFFDRRSAGSSSTATTSAGSTSTPKSASTSCASSRTHRSRSTRSSSPATATRPTRRSTRNRPRRRDAADGLDRRRRRY